MNDIASSITATLTTRLLLSSRGEKPLADFVKGDEVRLTLDSKHLASIIDELARNTTQLVMPLREKLEESIAWLAVALEVIDAHAREFSTAKQQETIDDIRDFCRRARMAHLDALA